MDCEKIGYEIIDEKNLRFVFNSSLFEEDGKSTGYYIAGSFNDWNFHYPKEWELSLENQEMPENKVFVLWQMRSRLWRMTLRKAATLSIPLLMKISPSAVSMRA